MWGATMIFLKETNPVILKAKGRRQQTDGENPVLSQESQNYGTLNTATSSDPTTEIPPPPDRIFTKGTMIPIANLGFHAFMAQCCYVLNPLVLSTSVKLGGLGLNPYEIGLILGTWGALNGLLQVMCSAWIIKKLGAKRTYMLTFGGQIFSFLCLAAIGVLVQKEGVTVLVKALLVLYFCLLTLFSTAYTSVYIFVIDSANERTLGSINGLAQMVASVLRGVAPVLASSLYSVSLEQKLLGGTFVYWVLISITLMGIFTSSKLPNQFKA